MRVLLYETIMNRSEIDTLYKTYGFIIYGRCIRILHDKEDARDAMQVVFMKLIQAYGSIHDKQKVVPWIFRTAQNHCFNCIRNRKKYTNEINPDDMRDTSDDQELMVKKDLIARVMHHFTGKVRDAVYYTYIEEFDQREIQKITGQSPATVRRNLKRFRESLPSILKRLGIHGV
jgi:RNA polymerase sigma-70 factor, ECF subfamily